MCEWDLVVCPGCGWTGTKGELDEYGYCHNCGYEVDGGMLSVKELLDDELEYHSVRLDLFLRALQEIGLLAQP